MNLAQATAICLYGTAKAVGEAQGFGPRPQQTRHRRSLRWMYGHMRKTLLDIGYLDPRCPDHIMRSFRRIFGEAGLNGRDLTDEVEPSLFRGASPKSNDHARTEPFRTA